MKKRLGLILILLSFIITWLCWIPERLASSMYANRQYSQLIASIALVVFTWINYISSRHRLIDKIFHGLDKSYAYHKYLSILAIILIWGHDLTLKTGRSSGGKPSGFKPPAGFERGGEGGGNILSMFTNGKQLGTLSLYIFTGLTIFFLIAYKLEYEKWKLLHKLMIVPYVFGVVHYYLDSDYPVFALSAYSIWMNIMNAIGVLSAVYSICIYEYTAFRYKYEVTSVKEIAKDTYEITGTTNGKSLLYKAGQFAFMKVIGRKKGFPSHPFTMSQSEKIGQIQFAIKVLGDHTKKLQNNIKTGDTIAVAGPHGAFDYRVETKRQLWVAGGIGITPFRSFLQSDIPNEYNIDFFYAYNNEQDAPYAKELEDIKSKKNVRIHLLDSSKSGFLGVEHISKYLNKDETVEVFFCGPKPMRKNIAKELKKENYKVKEFHYEQFQFK
ncbi:FAD-binding oxidoreductase [Clostridium manihotivorum]|uniref:FAD-binding FR-type domain-containing protein n=1 Tax=Clostridium manihotivorum TaxID=2320868 RepID=A0A410DSF0_9CLOT|nr:FAD-binding oxidoreductase [Clostridium manihotivorum]QAA31981.1 hypothetical protein C1I91_10140 [Clostridium manihotivorum]